MGRTEILGSIVEDLTQLEDAELQDIKHLLEAYKADRNAEPAYPYDPAVHGPQRDLADTLRQFDRDIEVEVTNNVKGTPAEEYLEKCKKWLADFK